MKNKRILTIAAAIVALATMAAFGIFWQAQPVQAKIATAGPLMPVDPTPTPCPGQGPECYLVLPSHTDNIDCADQPYLAIGCEDLWGKDANNTEHLLYLPPQRTNTGKLLVYLPGEDGSAGRGNDVPKVATERGYHVIQLTYPSANANGCSNLANHQNPLDCFGNAFHEAVTGHERSTSPAADKSTVSLHRQDSIVNRLVKVLLWARDVYPNDGWGAYLTTTDEVDWTKIHLFGFSNGSSHVGYMGTMPEFQSVKRIALLAGPNDGVGGTAEEWDSASYIQLIPGITDTRYYGLVHWLNRADQPDNNGQPPAYQIYKNWHKFGMEGPVNRPRFEFDPGEPGVPENFDGAHMLVSIDPERLPADDPPPWGTTKEEAHVSVGRNVYCTEVGPDLPDNPTRTKCLAWGNVSIGYEPAWRCILGTGDYYASRRPVSNAGPVQTVECQGNGGANVALDGSRSSDLDCDILTYAWSGPFGSATGRNPTVFCPLGFNFVGLVASDDWWSSLLPSTTLVNVVDTQAPSLQVTLTPTVLWTPDHRLVSIDATVNVADTCGGTPPQVVLTSITSDQPDNGVADGDTDNDIQGEVTGTLDQSFLLRSERAGNDPNGRTYTITYTATDASGNQTQTSATVRVPHSQ
jgi:hypothetical protein